MMLDNVACKLKFKLGIQVIGNWRCNCWQIKFWGPGVAVLIDVPNTRFRYFLVYCAPHNFTPVNLECAFGTKIANEIEVTTKSSSTTKEKEAKIIEPKILFNEKVYEGEKINVKRNQVRKHNGKEHNFKQYNNNIISYLFYSLAS